MPTATAIRHSVKSSREPVRATCQSSHGKTRRPTTTINAIKSATSPSVTAMVITRPGCPSAAAGDPSSQTANAGSSTRTSTIARSSTMSQPMAMRPLIVSSARRCSSARSSTTVLATDSARPNTTAAPKPQSQNNVATVARGRWQRRFARPRPGTAILRTASRSSSEKCRPTPNMRSITPISASCCERSTSATNPGVDGPRITPATK